MLTAAPFVRTHSLTVDLRCRSSYLDYEEGICRGDSSHAPAVLKLYERCLVRLACLHADTLAHNAARRAQVACANYAEMWDRYAAFLTRRCAFPRM